MPIATPTDVPSIIAYFERRGTKKNREGMARYGIVAPKVFGVSVTTVRALAKQIGRDHALAGKLWATGWYEARMLCAFVDEPARVTPAQMDRWARAFDNWAICDGICFHLFDRTPHAYAKVKQWATRREEFVKRAAFALLAALALHDKNADDARFVTALRLIEPAARDDRNFVKKGASWALRSVGQRNLALHERAIAIAKRLATSPDAAPRWIGKDALRDLQRPLVMTRLRSPARKKK